ncbi:hypothetical protein GOP47_0005427 [Adiantum capillus-veneris]|uniref:Uncharacterized protein n=1 Tax=Adiantum capillus-veneris TaxID=13818 RepID=A0A9D4V5B8_ADICA|nr:hypothetical protein GOP47_0005427 [Adiantum capillus-veneris]
MADNPPPSKGSALIEAHLPMKGLNCITGFYEEHKLEETKTAGLQKEPSMEAFIAVPFGHTAENAALPWAPSIFNTQPSCSVGVQLFLIS